MTEIYFSFSQYIDKESERPKFDPELLSAHLPCDTASGCAKELLSTQYPPTLSGLVPRHLSLAIKA